MHSLLENGAGFREGNPPFFRFVRHRFPREVRVIYRFGRSDDVIFLTIACFVCGFLAFLCGLAALIEHAGSQEEATPGLNPVLLRGATGAVLAAGAGVLWWAARRRRRKGEPAGGQP